MLFAFSMASSGVRKVSTDSTGPKISSCAIRLDWATLVNSVGRTKKPRVGQLAGGLVHLGALCLAGLDELLDLGQLGRVVDRADVGVLVHRIADAQRGEAVLERSTKGPDRFLDEEAAPAQHTSPWLKKMPLTTPSIAWSIGASSKTMLAALPPSSSVSALSRPGDGPRDLLAHRGRSGEGHLVDVRVLDERNADLARAR